VRLDIDFDDITVEEAELIEDYSGLSLEDFFKEIGTYHDENKNPPMKLLTPIIWIAGRRDDPKFTIEQARKVKFSELQSPEGNAPAPAGESNGTAKRTRPKKEKAVSAS
jgi:hypothetical protein